MVRIKVVVEDLAYIGNWDSQEAYEQSTEFAELKAEYKDKYPDVKLIVSSSEVKAEPQTN